MKIGLYYKESAPAHSNEFYTQAWDAEKEVFVFSLEDAVLQGTQETAFETRVADCAAEATIGQIRYTIQTKDFVENNPVGEQEIEKEEPKPNLFGFGFLFIGI